MFLYLNSKNWKRTDHKEYRLINIAKVDAWRSLKERHQGLDFLLPLLFVNARSKIPTSEGCSEDWMSYYANRALKTVPRTPGAEYVFVVYFYDYSYYNDCYFFGRMEMWSR